MNELLIRNAKDYIKELFAGNSDGHDFDHSLRVYSNAMTIAETESDVSAFKKDMKGIYGTSISADTLDEAPVAYRSIDEILAVVEETVEVKQILKPVYNFKAGKER